MTRYRYILALPVRQEILHIYALSLVIVGFVVLEGRAVAHQNTHWEERFIILLSTLFRL
jgi:hypothetical protein